MAKICALSTFDNPYNPFTDFDNWNAYDMQNGYNSCAYLARVVGNTDGIDAPELEEMVENAIDRIVKLNLTGNYVKIYAN